MRQTLLLLIVVLSVISVSAVRAEEEDKLRGLLKQGLFGAGVGAISAEASGGKAGKGAAVGAGANVLGNVVMDALSTPKPKQAEPAPYPGGYQQVPAQRGAPVGQGAISNQDAYQRGYQDGYRDGYKDGLRDANR